MDHESWARPARSGVLAAGIAAIALAGCGTATAPSTNRAAGADQSTLASTAAAGPPSHKPASPRFLTEVNTVCRAVRQGAPTAVRPPYTTSALSRYAAAAQAPAHRTVVSLQRLATVGGAATLQPIIAGYSQLQSAYTSTRVLPAGNHQAQQLGGLIRVREQLVSDIAREAGAPACGVAGR